MKQDASLTFQEELTKKPAPVVEAKPIEAPELVPPKPELPVVVAKVEPKAGYGEKSGARPQSIPLAAVEGIAIRPGMTFVVEDDDGEQMPLRVVEVRDDHAIVDTDHPLAGETLHFQGWYRDHVPSSTSNFTSGVRVTFQ